MADDGEIRARAPGGGIVTGGGERLAEAILRTVRQPILVLDAQLHAVEANAAFYRTFGVDPARTLGRGLYTLGNGQWDIPALRALMEQVLPRDSTVRDFRVEHSFEGLGPRVMLLNADRILRDGRTDRILLTFDDITEAEVARQEAVAEKEFVDKIVDATREALLILGWDLRVRRANETFYTLFNVDPAETEGRMVYELGNGQWNIPGLRELLERILPADSSFDDFEVRHDFAGIGPRVMMLNARRVDHLQYILLAIEDRTEAQQALTARDETAARFQALVAASSDFIYTMSADWSELRIPFRAGDGAQMPVPGFAWLERFIPPEDREPVLAAMRRAIRNRTTFEAEHRLWRADGSTLWVLSRAVPVTDARGEVVEWFGAASDITARRAAEDALRQSEEKQRFLLALSDALRPIRDPAEIEECACRMLAERLEVDRAYFVDIDLPQGIAHIQRDQVRGGAASLAGDYRLSDFGWSADILRRGDCVMIRDTQDTTILPEVDRLSSAALGIVAAAGVPLFRDGVLAGALCVTDRRRRDWSGVEMDILREVASRIWFAVQSARAEAERRESDARYRMLFDSIDQGFCVIRMIFDAEGRACDYVFVEVNASFERQTGLRDPRGRNVSDLVPALEREWFDIYGRVARTRRAERFEMAARPLGAHYDVYAFPVGTPDQDQVGVLFTDVADRKRAERALMDSEARLAAIFKQASVGLCEITTEGRVLRANDELARILGRPLAEVTGLSVVDVTHPGDLDASRAMIARTLAGGPDPGAAGIDKRYLQPDGRVVWANSRASLLPARDGAPATLLVVTVDLTQRKAAEAAIRDSEERFQQFGAASSDALWVWNLETRRWEYLSAAFGAISGLDRAQLLTEGGVEPLVQIIHPEDRAATATAFRALRDGPRSFDFRILHPQDGSIRWMRTTGFALAGDDGVVRRVGGITHDMTEEVRISGRMRVLLAELQHRTRNLIGVVRAMSTRTLRTSASLEEYSTRFGNRLEALARVNSLLSRLEEGDRVTFDELIHAEFKAHGIAGRDGGQVSLKGPSGVRLPSASVQTLALALHELLTNATKHGALATPEGRLSVEWQLLPGPEPRLRLDWRESGGKAPPAAPAKGGPGAGRVGGYGRELIERALPYQLGAATDYRLTATELHCTVTLPLPPRANEARDG